MRLFISFLMFTVGAGFVAYSYVGSVFEVASDAKESAVSGDETGAVWMVLEFILAGELPQLSGYLYGGLFLVIVAVVYLMLGDNDKRDRDDADY